MNGGAQIKEWHYLAKLLGLSRGFSHGNSGDETVIFSITRCCRHVMGSKSVRYLVMP